MKIIYDDIIYSLQKSGGGSVYWTEVTKRQDEKAIHNVYNNANEPKAEHVYTPSKNLKFVRITLTEPLSGTEIDVQTITIVH